MKLKELRIKKGLTQKEIADILDITHATVSRIENEVNVMNSTQIIKLCKALDIRADQLLGLEELDK